MIGIVFTIALATSPAVLEGQVLTLALVVAPSTDHDPGQDPAKPAPVPASPAPQDVPAATPMKIASPPVPMTNAERLTFRESISYMESLLANAVVSGARRLLVDNPGLTLVPAGQPSARGFVLDGYGLFFDVEIPELNGSVELTMLLQRELQKRIEEQQSGPKRASQGIAQLDDPDPSIPYRDAVISAIIDVMLNYSKNLNVQPNEWMSVALRGSEVPPPQGIRDSRTILLRIKGSDLTDFLANRISKEEAFRRVEKQEF
jgi:hypothetical protein